MQRPAVAGAERIQNILHTSLSLKVLLTPRARTARAKISETSSVGRSKKSILSVAVIRAEPNLRIAKIC